RLPVSRSACAGHRLDPPSFPTRRSSDLAVRLKEELERLQLPLVLINLPAGDLMQGGDGLACVPARQAEFDQALEAALSYAAMVRPQAVNVLAGRLPAGVAREQALATLSTNWRRAAGAFQALCSRVCCEAMNPLDMPGFLINTPEALLGLLDAVGHPYLSAQLDLYHLARQGLDVPAIVRTLAGHLGHVQFADHPGRGAPGTGELDFSAALQALREVGYDGWLAAEYRPDAAGTEAGLGWLSTWKKS